jgi:zinc transport system permease protein
MLEIFQYDFMVRAFIAGTIIAAISPLIGTFLVVRRYSMMADTLAHVALAGLAVGVLLQTQPVFTAMITTVVAAIGMEQLRIKRNIMGESVLALFLSGSLAIAAVLLSIAKGTSMNPFAYLFGSIATVSAQDVQLIAVLGGVVVLIVLLFYKQFFFVSFDEELAKASGLRVQALHLLLIVLAAVTVSLAMRIVGALLVGSLMVIPVIAATQFGRGFRSTIGIGIAISLLAMLSGLTLSYYFGTASGGTIVVVALACFAASLCFNQRNA